MADTTQHPEEYAMVQIELTSTSSGSSLSSKSTHDSEITTVSRDSSTLPLPAEVSGAAASPVGLTDDTDREAIYNIATPAHIVHRPPPQSATPSKDVPKFVELEPGLKFIPQSPTTIASWRYEGRATAPCEDDDPIVEPMEIEPR
ncbi:hypothetical protein CERSUDRAFT_96677 [Gelatoporia subvermispora B]|uniref:Uncharacterized protein n=1 Tax=Ceriporiopsis subvermispora (strain B) TaxID=914234 RepID=M2R9W3_CERS8|nr:hypothetical protein CERSUDRAFT_96677 [Gelatoporia subvermispora B]